MHPYFQSDPKPNFCNLENSNLNQNAFEESKEKVSKDQVYINTEDFRNVSNNSDNSFKLSNIELLKTKNFEESNNLKESPNKKESNHSSENEKSISFEKRLENSPFQNKMKSNFSYSGYKYRRFSYNR